MPFDVHDFPDASRMDRAATRQSRRLVAIWLFTVAAMIMVMIVLGGVTRLTGSGLSIMEWAPIMGALPPTTDARMAPPVRPLSKNSPVHPGERRLRPCRLQADLLAGMDPSPVGTADRRRLPACRCSGSGPPPGSSAACSRAWRCCSSSAACRARSAGSWSHPAFFPDSTAVSPYRLVIHLVLALVLYAAIVWTGLSALLSRSATAPPVPPWLRRLAFACLVMVSLTIVAGGFTAGLHAGLDLQHVPADGWPPGAGRLRDAASARPQPDREHRRRAVRSSPAGDR